MRYAQARAAILHLAYQHDAVTLVLQAGTQTLQPRHPGEDDHTSTGSGLSMLRQRAAQLRGTLELTCDPAGHTVLRLELPTRPFWRRPP